MNDWTWKFGEWGKNQKKSWGGSKKSFSFHTVVQLLQTLKNKVFFNKERFPQNSDSKTNHTLVTFWDIEKFYFHYSYTKSGRNWFLKKEKENQKFYLVGSQKLWFYFYGDSRWCLMKCCSCLDFYKFLPELIWNRKYRILVNVPKVPQMVKMLNPSKLRNTF